MTDASLWTTAGLDKVTKVTKAFQFALEAHGDQLDDTGKSYFYTHVVQVANLVMLVTEDTDIVCAAYLHDTLEDTKVTVADLRANFGNRVADLVLEVTHEGQKDNHGYYFPRLATRDGILLKFADRLSNISRMEAWDEKRQEQYLKKSKFWKSE